MNTTSGGKFTLYSLDSIITQFITFFLTMLSSIMTARLLGPSGKGLLTLLLMIPWLTTVFGRMGIGHAINYYSSRIDNSALFVNVLLLSVVISSILVTTTIIILYFIYPTIPNGASTFAIVGTIILIPLYLYNDYLTNILLGSYRISERNRLLISQSFITLLLIGMLALIQKISVINVIFVTFISLLSFIIGTIFILIPTTHFSTSSFDLNIIKHLLKFGYRAHWGNIFIDLSYRGDIFIIGSLLPSYYVGCYAVAVMISELLWKVPDAVSNTLLGRVSKMTPNEARRFTPRVCRLILFYMLIAIGIMFVAGKWVVLTFFGAAYSDSILVLILLLPGTFCFSIWKILANDLIAQGHPSQYSYSSFMSLIVMVTLDLVLIPLWDIKGAAIATTVAYMTATVNIVYIYLKTTNINILDIIKPKLEDFIQLKAAFVTRK
ncbi:MAG: hypothetical protein A3J83_07420 [Elusimicrobia bacterium RIFOXYA2_FULL_40_6]|nr:MAG: hypothetical protein A3J83_07420 [Elusimicrobia bacterium RIFOXYA2_FULL_40_6]